MTIFLYCEFPAAGELLNGHCKLKLEFYGYV